MKCSKENVVALRETSQKIADFMNKLHGSEMFVIPTEKQMETQIKKLKAESMVVVDGVVMFYVSADPNVVSKEELHWKDRETVCITSHQTVDKGKFPEIPKGGTIFIQYWVEHKEHKKWIVRFKHHPEKRYKIKN